MPKVKCENCRYWLYSYTQRMRDRTYMFSFHFAYKQVKKGSCMNDKCAEETSGYTGITSSHKMSRRGGTERYCKFFTPKIKTQKCPECGQQVPEQNMVLATAMTTTGLEYKIRICLDCFHQEKD